MVFAINKVVHKMFSTWLYSYQQLFLYDCLNNQRVIGVFCRQTGKSMTIAILSIIEALKKENAHIVIVAPTDRQAGELFEKITIFIQRSPIIQEIENITKRELRLKNGSRISAFPCGDTGANIRGMTANVLIEEEAAFIKDSINNQVLMPMVAATNGKVIKISTPFGMNHFYNDSIGNNYKLHCYDWRYAVKENHFSIDFIKEQKRLCTDLEFRTEYCAEFIPDQDNYFSFELIKSCICDIELIFSPMQGKQYYLGGDIARLGSDSTVLVIIEKGDVNQKNKVVNIIEIKKCTLDIAIEKILELHNTFKFKKIFIDETGLGAGVTDVLARKLNPSYSSNNIMQQTKTYNSTDIVIGVTFTIKTKMDIYSNLKILMEQRKLIYPDNRKLIYQLQDFKYEQTDSGNVKLHHSSGGYDDYCDAMALAVQGLKTREVDFFFA